MDYYERKEKAMRLIRKCVNAGMPHKEICFSVLETFAMSDKFTKDFIYRYEDEIEARKKRVEEAKNAKQGNKHKVVREIERTDEIAAILGEKSL